MSFPEEGQDEITPQEMMIDDAAIRSAETEEAVSQAVSQIQMSTSQIKQEIRAELQAEMVSQAAASEETAESQEPEEADPADIAAQARKSLVTVAGIRSGYDWAGDVYESSGKTSGVIVADNGEELLILSGARQLIGAERIQVTFADGMSCDAGIKSRDTLTNMCILKVARGEIPETTLEAVEPAVLGSSLRNDLIGRDVIAVGSPMGTQGSVAFGIITNASFFSKMSGTQTYREDYVTENRHKWIPESIQEVTVTEQSMRKQAGGADVYMTDDVYRIKGDEVLIRASMHNPFMAKRYFWKRHPLSEVHVRSRLTGEIVELKACDHIPHYKSGTEELYDTEIYELVDLKKENAKTSRKGSGVKVDKFLV